MGGELFEPAIPISEFKAGGNRKGSHNKASAMPILVVDASQTHNKDLLYVVWPDRRSGHSEILLSYSADQGKT